MPLPLPTVPITVVESIDVTSPERLRCPLCGDLEWHLYAVGSRALGCGRCMGIKPPPQTPPASGKE